MLVNTGWWSQPFAPEGSAAAEGIVKQLGRPTLDPLTVLVREAAQNSADAHRQDVDVVDFRIDVRTLGDAVEKWRGLLLPALPLESGVGVDSALTRETVVLVISDRNTVGLGGPVRANRKDSAERRSDFVQFLRNVGEPSDHELGGGTYGFGKGVFYRVSRCRTILVDTHTQETGELSRRLMGAGLGQSWVLEEHRFTGRHWWGRIADDGIPDPLLGDAASAAAELLGLPGFSDGRTGTDIVVVAADLGITSLEQEAGRPRTPHEAATYLQSAILWNLWPKFLSDERNRRMRFTVAVQGEDVEVPSPDTLEEFEPFIESLKEVRAGAGTAYTRVTPPKVGGSFSLALTDAERDTRRLVVSAACPFDGPPHHVARMRSVELVVDYVAGPTHPNPRFAYGAVFKASQEADRAFAMAEPPTHDDWIVTGLSGTVRGVVQGARTFLNKQLDERVGFGSQAGGGGQGLGQLAARLASVIPARLPEGSPPSDDGSTSPGVAGGGERQPVGGAGGGTGLGSSPGGATGPVGVRSPGRRSGAPRVIGAPTLEVFNGEPYAVARVLVSESAVARTVTAEAFVVVEGGGKEAEAPAGALVPRVVQWQPAAEGGRAVHSATLSLPPGPDSEWWVYATHVPDAVIRFRVGQEATRAE